MVFCVVFNIALVANTQRFNSVHWPGSKSRRPLSWFCSRAAGPGSGPQAPGCPGRLPLWSVLVWRLPGSGSLSRLHTSDCLWPSYQGELFPRSSFTLLPPFIFTGISSITGGVQVAHSMLSLLWNSMDLQVAGKYSVQSLATVHLKEAEAESVELSLPMAGWLNN